MMYILNIISAIKKIEIKDFTYEKYYNRVGFPKENSYFSMKNQKKIDLLSYATKLIEKDLILVIPKNTINLI